MDLLYDAVSSTQSSVTTSRDGIGWEWEGGSRGRRHTIPMAGSC